MTRHDVKKLDAYQARKGELRLIEVPASRFLAIDETSDPNTEVFARAVEALYPFAYTLKFASKTELGQDYVVPPARGVVVGRGPLGVHDAPRQVPVVVDALAARARVGPGRPGRGSPREGPREGCPRAARRRAARVARRKAVRP